MIKWYLKLQNAPGQWDKVQHFLLAFILAFNPTIALTALVTIELVQIDIFGIKGRVKDTILDLVADLLGFIIGRIVWLLIISPMGF